MRVSTSSAAARVVAGISYGGLAVTPERERLTLALLAYAALTAGLWPAWAVVGGFALAGALTF